MFKPIKKGEDAKILMNDILAEAKSFIFSNHLHNRILGESFGFSASSASNSKNRSASSYAGSQNGFIDIGNLILQA